MPDHDLPHRPAAADRPIRVAEAERGHVDPEILADLDDFANAVADLTPGDCSRLVAFWKGVDPDEQFEAHENALIAVIETGRRDLIRSLQAELSDWSHANPSGRIGASRLWNPGQDSDPFGNDRAGALPALADAALALALQDRLEENDFDALFGPWSHAMGVADIELDADEKETRSRSRREPV